TDLGKAYFLLGIEIICKCGQITCNQATYFQKILKRFQLTSAYPVSILLNPDTKLHIQPTTTEVTEGEHEDLPTDEGEGCSMISSLMYLILYIRQDIAFA